MISRLCTAVVLASLLAVGSTAQTIRFDTNVGTFDMELNPTGDPDLQPYVENLLAYVDSGRYDSVVINRAANNSDGTPFILQMGGFQATTLRLPDSFSDLTPVPSFPNLIQDADGDNIVDIAPSTENGLINSRGTVSIALQSTNPLDASAPENVNSGTREFFVNVGRDNTFLDTDGGPGNFVPFAEVSDMATVDLIMGLDKMQTPDGDGRSSDMPILPGNRLVFIERAFVIETLSDQAAALRDAQMEAMMDEEGETLAAVSVGLDASAPAAVQAIAVPEPPALVLAIGALVMIYILKPSKQG